MIVSQTTMISVPDTNLAAFRLLFEIENTLRLLICSSLEHSLGPKWHKGRLPPDLLSKFKQSLEYERQIAWQDLSPHHPIFYLDFPDLRKVIDRKDNWNDVFSPIFGDKTVLMGHLVAVEPVRNKIAHNRYINSSDLQHLQVCYEMIRACEPPMHIDAKHSFTVTTQSIRTSLSGLKQEIFTLTAAMSHFESAGSTEAWEQCRGAWWFDEDYLFIPLECITSFYELVDAYMSLPRRTGQGYKIEAWVKASSLDKHLESCNKNLSKLLGEQLWIESSN